MNRGVLQPHASDNSDDSDEARSGEPGGTPSPGQGFMSKDRPTIEMIAKLAGVSRGTVDRVVNHRPNVNEEKRLRVEKIIKKLNYQPNLAARALAKRGVQKRTLAVLYPDWPGFFENEIRRGIDAASKELAFAGFEILAEKCVSKLPADFNRAIDKPLDKGATGLAVCAANNIGVSEKIQSVVANGVPVVTFNSDVADSGRITFVGPDIKRTGKIAAGLIERITPHELNVLIVAGNMEFKGHKDRVDGFLEHWRGLGRDEDKCILMQTYNDFDITFQKVIAALAEYPDIGGIYMANDSVPACVEALGQTKMPRRVRIVGHDLSPEHRSLLLYGAVDFIIGQDIFFQGYRPLQLLAGILDGNGPRKDAELTGVNIITAESVL
ncbi:MAG: substrate-binding domain-containing protein [Planctomycetes bacterium]|nr:substrate-binding domain-containing protein [Planctomycetota bacterium]